MDKVSTYLYKSVCTILDYEAKIADSLAKINLMSYFNPALVGTAVCIFAAAISFNTKYENNRLHQIYESQVRPNIHTNYLEQQRQRKRRRMRELLDY
jgi:hypothetical protein